MDDPAKPVVYDLDGTLVRLPVDWPAATEDADAALREAGLEPGDRDLWGLLELARESGASRAFESAVCSHERAAAVTSNRLSMATELRERDGPVGVCSLNCEAACRVALETHGLAEHVDAVVGRDSVGTHKPDPAPLLAVLEAMGCAPGEAEFVGDTERDEETAERAGVAFRWVE